MWWSLMGGEWVLTRCPRIPRLEGTLWVREGYRADDWKEWGDMEERFIFLALEPRNKNECGRFMVSCMDWEEGNAWLPDHMGTWERVV